MKHTGASEKENVPVAYVMMCVTPDANISFLGIHLLEITHL